MNILLIFLISSAFGRPSSDPRDVGAELSSHLNDIVQFSNETGKILLDSKLTKDVIKMLLEAEETVLDMHAELETLKIKLNSTYFSTFIDAKSYLRKARQDLRKLADKTLKDVRDAKSFFEALDEINDSSDANLFLELLINTMKDLMIETLDTLKKAKIEYNSAMNTFDNLNFEIKTDHQKLERMLDRDSAEYKAWTTKTRVGENTAIGGTDVALILADVFGCLGICSAVGNVASISTFAGLEVEIERLKTIADRMLEGGIKFEKAINVATDVLEDEIEIIGKWTQSAKIVSDNIDQYDKELLRMFKSIRTVFISGLDQLKNDAEEFLAQPKINPRIF